MSNLEPMIFFSSNCGRCVLIMSLIFNMQTVFTDKDINCQAARHFKRGFTSKFPYEDCTTPKSPHSIILMNTDAVLIIFIGTFSCPLLYTSWLFCFVLSWVFLLHLPFHGLTYKLIYYLLQTLFANLSVRTFVSFQFHSSIHASIHLFIHPSITEFIS